MNITWISSDLSRTIESVGQIPAINKLFGSQAIAIDQNKILAKDLFEDIFEDEKINKLIQDGVISYNFLENNHDWLHNVTKQGNYYMREEEPQEFYIKIRMIESGIIKGLRIEDGFLISTNSIFTRHATPFFDSEIRSPGSYYEPESWMIPLNEIFEQNDPNPSIFEKSYNIYINTHGTKFQFLLTWNKLCELVQAMSNSQVYGGVRPFTLTGNINEERFSCAIRSDSIDSIVMRPIETYIQPINTDDAINEAEEIVSDSIIEEQFRSLRLAATDMLNNKILEIKSALEIQGFYPIQWY